MKELFDLIKTNAQEYVKINLPIMPLCPFDHSDMDKEHCDKCKSPGKAPIIKGWQHRQETTMREAKKWWIENPKFNIGLVLGNTENWNLIGIDIDGDKGLEYWNDMIKDKEIPPTWEYKTGGGKRLLFNLPSTIKTKKKSESLDGNHQEVAFIGQGQQTVLPPSIHPSGKRYEWIEGKSPWEADIAMAPLWIMDIVQDEEDEIENYSDKVVSEEFVNIVEGNRDNLLTRYVGSLASNPAMNYDEILAAAHVKNNVFNPPLENAQVVKIVKSIWETELKSREKERQREARRQNNIPLNLTKGFVSHCLQKGRFFRYRKSRKCLMTCTSLRGPWEVLDREDFNMFCIDYLRNTDPKLVTTSRINEIYTLLPSRIRDLSNSDGEEFDDLSRFSEEICVSNGVYNWKHNELEPWNPNKHFHTIEINATYTPKIHYGLLNQWNDSLMEWIADESTIMFIQEYIGYMLLPIVDMRTAVFLSGGGSNGKSIFIECVTTLFESCKKNITLKSIASKHGGVDIEDKLCLICADMDKEYITETGKIKEIIGGDSIRVEPKGKASYDVVPYGKILMSANALPTTIDKSTGWYSRLQIIHFGKTFKTDGLFKRKMIAMANSTEGRSMLFNWACEGLARLKDQGSFTIGHQLEKSKEEYEELNDCVKQFMNNCLRPMRVVEDTDDYNKVYMTSIGCKALYEMFKHWCETEGINSNVKKVDFTKKVSEHYPIKSVGFPAANGGRYVSIKAHTCVLLSPDLEEDIIDAYKYNMNPKVDIIKVMQI